MGELDRRIEWIDSAKAFGMLLVYIGHCFIPGVNQYIYSFHLSLFFIISGFCWRNEKYLNLSFSEFAFKKIRSYIIPYFKICVVCFVPFCLLTGLLQYGLQIEFWKYILRYLFGIFVYSRGTLEWLPNCSPVWFLTCLFCAELVLFLIMKAKLPLLLIIISGCIGYEMSLLGKIFPWNIDSAMTAIPLIYMGMLLKKYWAFVSNPMFLFALVPLSIVLLVSGVKCVDFDGNRFDNILAMYLQSGLISLTILIVFSLFSHGIGAKYGKETILLLGYNYAINSVISLFPSMNHNWLMALTVVVAGALFVRIVNKYKRIKTILV